VQPERDQVRLQEGTVAADLQPQQRVVEHGAGGGVADGRLGQELPCPGVAQVRAGVAANVVQVVVVGLGYGQVEVLAEQREDLRAAVGLELGLERVAPGQGKAGLAERSREPGVGGDPRLVHTGRVHDRAAGAAGVAGQRGNRARVVRLGRRPAADAGQGGLDLSRLRPGGQRALVQHRRALHRERRQVEDLGELPDVLGVARSGGECLHG